MLKNWQLFKQKFKLFLTATETAPKSRPEATKTALLLTAAGEEAIEVFNASFAAGESDTSYATVLKKFDEYCETQSKEIYERYLFRKWVQEQGETFEHFLRDLKTQERVLQRRAQPRSYNVITEDGKLLHRNRSHLIDADERSISARTSRRP